MTRRLLTRLLHALTGRVPAKWDDELAAAVARHPAGKALRPGDPQPGPRP